MGFKVVLGRAAALQEIRWGSGEGRAAQNREEDPNCPRPYLQVGSGGLGLPNSLWRPPGLAQVSLLKHSIPLEEGLIDLEGWKEQFRMGKGRCLLHLFANCSLKTFPSCSLAI